MRYVGVDEVGNGALAGPLVAAAVAIDAPVRFEELKRWWPLAGVRDSKRLTFAQREALLPELVPFLLRSGASVQIVEASAREIDERGHASAHLGVLTDAVRGVVEDAGADLVIVDGRLELPSWKIRHVEQRAAPHADADYWVVAAASILAKVHRDRLMVGLAREFPAYGFDQNMGYTGGSKATSPHVRALRLHGPTPHHRRAACRTVLS